jgi:hypothetical protein
MIRLKLFSEWQEYRGGRALRQILLQPSYMKKRKYLVLYHQITHSHIILLLSFDGNQILVVLDRLVHDGSYVMDVTIDYLENSSYSLQQWLDSSGCFQLQLDQIPIFIQLVKVIPNDFLWVIMPNGSFLCWKYDYEHSDWSFGGKYNLMSEAQRKSMKFLCCSFFDSSQTLIWIEEGNFEKDTLDFQLHDPKYRVRMTKINQNEVNTIQFSPSITLFNSESYYFSHLSSNTFYFFTRKRENQLISYSLLTGNLHYFDLNQLTVAGKTSEDLDSSDQLFVDNSLDIEVIPHFNIANPNFPDSASKIGINNSSNSAQTQYGSLPNTRKELPPKERLFLLNREKELLFLLEQDTKQFSKLIVKQIVDISFTALSPSLSSNRKKKVRQMNATLFNEMDYSFHDYLVLSDDAIQTKNPFQEHFFYLGYISSQKKELEIYRIPILSSLNTVFQLTNYSALSKVSIEFPFQYIHGKDIETYFLTHSFQPAIITTKSANNPPRRTQVPSVYSEATVVQTYWSIPIIWNASGIFQLEIPFTEEDIRVHNIPALGNIRFAKVRNFFLSVFIR